MSYEDYLKKQKEYVESKAADIAKVNKDKMPQGILWNKMVCSKLEDDKAYSKTIEDNYYFTELLVNKLMYFAYLQGSKAFEENSYQKGWQDCRRDVAEKLGFEEDN